MTDEQHSQERRQDEDGVGNAGGIRNINTNGGGGGGGKDDGVASNRIGQSGGSGTVKVWWPVWPTMTLTRWSKESTKQLYS